MLGKGIEGGIACCPVSGVLGKGIEGGIVLGSLSLVESHFLFLVAGGCVKFWSSIMYILC